MNAKPRPLIVHSPGVLAVPLTRGLFALIDEADARLVDRLRWHAYWNGTRFYAARNAQGRKTLLMHRVLLAAASGLLVDHANGDGLDNRRANIRLATKAQNAHNAKTQSNNTSGFRGVSWHRRAGRWMARADTTYLGLFDSPEAAARAHDTFIIAARGVFARPNFPVV